MIMNHVTLQMNSCFSGNSWLPIHSSVRTVLAFHWLFCVVTVATFSANLVALLSVSLTPVLFHSFEDLAAEPQYRIGLPAGTMLEDLFKVHILKTIPDINLINFHNLLSYHSNLNSMFF